MNDGNHRDDDTRPLGDELFDAPRADAPGSDVHPTVPLSTDPSSTGTPTGGPASPEPLPTAPRAQEARDGDTSVLDVPSPAVHERPTAGAPAGSEPSPAGPAGPSSGPSAEPSRVPTDPWASGGQVPPARRGPRVSTIVWGFVIVAFGVVVLAAALGARVDLGLATIVVLATAGLTLVVGSIVSGARRRRG
ncbi:hypothetical protein JN535_10130 [Cellulosimicrobium cellulans]|uniref:hypothetical protein n=1 Tax=Cellulosimicrobium cellulans TaxID=1710 RepID=UPI001966C280|nr:hypothetical protein [Cellulosimicrobium cellulans]MBN0040520.1 hypothetical protein [Cellulosimicrobium cellulans]